MKEPTGGFDAEARKKPNYLYGVLNLPADATQEEIKERHRAFSLVFHPDKQRDERLRKTANEQFLEVQAAYEVLSDPFRREIYDTLGFEGLSVQFPEHFKGLGGYELREALHDYFYNNEAARLRSLVNPKGVVTLSVDARDLFQQKPLGQGWYVDLKERLEAVKFGIMSVQQTFSSRLGQQTSVHVTSRMGLLGDAMPTGDMDSLRQFSSLRGNISGIIKHQYSRKSTFEIRANLVNKHNPVVSWSYGNTLNRFSISAPLRFSLTPPPFTFLIRRRLYNNSVTFGTLKFILKPTLQPGGILQNVSVELSQPMMTKRGNMFGSGLAYGLTLRIVGGPAVFVQWMGICVPLGTTLRASIDQGLISGTSLMLECAWKNEEEGSGASATIIYGARGVVLKLSAAFFGQTFDIPVLLSDEHDPVLAIATTLIQTSIFTAFNYASLRKLRARKREKLLRDSLQTSQLFAKRADTETVLEMLREPARRSSQHEKQTHGIVILNASYYPLDEIGIPVSDLAVDVTVAVQALVTKGQLFIPAGRTKSAIRGFFDPLPEREKCLSIQYEFRGRQHYVEVSDQAALVIPLESHLVGPIDGQDHGK